MTESRDNMLDGMLNRVSHIACTVQIRGKANVSRRRPAGRTWPDVSVTAGACCPFRRRPAVTPACGRSTPACAHANDCARADDCTRRFLVEQ